MIRAAPRPAQKSEHRRAPLNSRGEALPGRRRGEFLLDTPHRLAHGGLVAPPPPWADAAPAHARGSARRAVRVPPLARVAACLLRLGLGLGFGLGLANPIPNPNGKPNPDPKQCLLRFGPAGERGRLLQAMGVEQ